MNLDQKRELLRGVQWGYFVGKPEAVVSGTVFTPMYGNLLGKETLALRCEGELVALKVIAGRPVAFLNSWGSYINDGSIPAFWMNHELRAIQHEFVIDE